MNGFQSSVSTAFRLEVFALRHLLRRAPLGVSTSICSRVKSRPGLLTIRGHPEANLRPSLRLRGPLLKQEVARLLCPLRLVRLGGAPSTGQTTHPSCSWRVARRCRTRLQSGGRAARVEGSGHRCQSVHLHLRRLGTLWEGRGGVGPGGRRVTPTRAHPPLPAP